MQTEASPSLGITSLDITRTVDLEPDHEFRFEVEFNKKVQIKLLKGTAEIFGTEIAVGVSYTFTGRKVAVYTWHGCALEISFFFQSFFLIT
ncbi:hypothetical protein O0I10_006149 [Lichtheimia ornata]|uniref:Clp1 N-terminal domain-containing protein n=1 Tax=Lichtheimia ornata TaxID=688661 RepID=A0AAD7V4S8_9FUNG|nr:uncharacterized protein O0I10_006149 [Lichtheimia ornata]KAJ8658142.1 hypothetical protein O0I10_006149 [Lichtheimia ornata]